MQAEKTEDLVMYLDRKVPKEGFRVYVYSKDGEEKIAESHDEYELLISSDKWFTTKEESKDQKITRKNVPRGT